MSRFALLCMLAACGDNLEPADTSEPAIVAHCSEAEIEQQLRAMPNVTSVRAANCGDYVVDGAHCFNIGITQPIDHLAPDKTFTQQLWLAHRGCDRPMIVADWGYSQDFFFDDELSVMFNSNTLWIEHRYQGASTPAIADWDWSALTIENGANDMHAIIDSFKHVYGGRWISTGASKGGITATYHSFFFPHDLDGAVPYVAPASRDRIDALYQAYLEKTLTQDCAQRVRDAQVAAVTTRRAMMLAHLTSMVAAGWEPAYLELMTAYFDWGFWQYRGARYCNQVPGAASTDDEFWNFYSRYSGVFDAPPGDELMSNGALNYEWLTEQGFALQIGAHVRDLLQDPYATQTMEENFRRQFPLVALPIYDGSVTRSVRKWVRERAEHVLLIYGQFDPWSGGAMDEPERPTSARFFVPQANHGAQIGELALADRTRALELASTFFGEAPRTERMGRAAEAANARTEWLMRKLQRQLLVMPR